jgi:signal transduction histidine kinase
MTASLRRRIALGTTVTTAVVILVASAVVWWAVRENLYHALDAALAERMRGALHHPDPGPPPSRLPRLPGPDGGFGPEPGPAGEPRAEGPRRPGPPEFAAGSGTMFAQIIDDDADLEIGRSPSLSPGSVLSGSVPDEVPDGRAADGRLADGRWLRVMRTTATLTPASVLPPWSERSARLPPPGEKHRITWYLAIDAVSTHHDLNRLALVLALVWLVATTLSALVSMWLRRAVLRPIDRLSALIAAIEPDNLKSPVPTTGVPDEMMVVLERLNSATSRLAAAFDRERSTIANIAHELRTPVAGIRATLEFALARGPHASRDEDLRECLSMTESMQRMIINLLTLARLESGQARLPAQRVGVLETVRECMALLEERMKERELTVVVRVDEQLTVLGGDEHLRMILGNVLDNAVSYALSGQPIEVTGTAQGGWACIEVANATDGRLKDVSEIFNAFWRGEEARTSGHHCGLGLTLVQRLVRLSGGTVSAQIDGLNLFRISLRLPVPPA